MISLFEVEYLRGIDLNRMAKQRVEKVRKEMRKHGFGALLTLDGRNTRYITPCKPGRFGVSLKQYAVLPSEGEPILYESGMHEGPHLSKPSRWWLGDRARYAIAFGSWAEDAGVKEVGLVQRRKFAKQIRDCLKSYGIENETLGVDVGVPSALESLEEVGIKTDAVNGHEMMVECRLTKTVDEVECLRMAARVGDACFAKIKDMIKPGVTEKQLIAALRYTATLLGAARIHEHSHLESGPNTWPNVACYSNRIIRPGDLVYSDIIIDFLGYTTCYYRTFSCGKPTQAQRDAYAKVKEYNWNFIKALKPGITSKELVEKWPAAEEFGYPNEDCALMMQVAHGVGLNNQERPKISRCWSLDYPVTLEKDMVLAVENIWPTGEKSIEYPNGQAVRLEEMVHITDSGYDMLTKFPSDEITVCEI